MEIEEIKKQYELEKEENLTPINFEKKQLSIAEVQPKKDVAGALIDQALGVAITHKVKSDENIQGRLLNTADKVIDTAMNVAENEADTKDKEANFNNKKGACECWGYNETTTEKKFVNAMAFIHSIFTAIWIGIGAITFAPIVFVAKKIQVIVKKTWIAVFIAVLIYLAIILTPTLLAVLGK